MVLKKQFLVRSIGSRATWWPSVRRAAPCARRTASNARLRWNFAATRRVRHNLGGGCWDASIVRRQAALRHQTSEQFETQHTCDDAGILASGGRGAADKVENLAVLHAVVGKTFHPALFVEIHSDHTLIGHI